MCKFTNWLKVIFFQNDANSDSFDAVTTFTLFALLLLNFVLNIFAEPSERKEVKKLLNTFFFFFFLCKHYSVDLLFLCFKQNNAKRFEYFTLRSRYLSKKQLQKLTISCCYHHSIYPARKLLCFDRPSLHCNKYN